MQRRNGYWDLTSFARHVRLQRPVIVDLGDSFIPKFADGRWCLIRGIKKFAEECRIRLSDHRVDLKLSYKDLQWNVSFEPRRDEHDGGRVSGRASAANLAGHFECPNGFQRLKVERHELRRNVEVRLDS
jgi:hypothetical protein